MTRRAFLALVSLSVLGAIPLLDGCAAASQESSQPATISSEETSLSNTASADSVGEQESIPLENITFFEPQTSAQDIIDDEAFEDYGRLLFPVTGYHAPDASTTLASLDSKLTWYNFYDVDTTIDVLSFLKNERLARSSFPSIRPRRSQPIRRRRIRAFSISAPKAQMNHDR